MRRAPTWLAVVTGVPFAVGCTHEALEIPLPALSPGGATAVALESGPASGIDRLVSVSLFDRDSTETIGVLPFDDAFRLEGDGRISLFEYEDGLGLEDLGYESGPLERGADLRLDDFPSTIRELMIDDGEPGVWRPRTKPVLDGPLAEFRFNNQQPNCACITGNVIETRNSTSATVFLARLGPRRVIVGAENGDMYWVHDDEVELVPLNDLLPFLPQDNNARAVGGGIAIGVDRILVTDYLGNFWVYEIDDERGLVGVTLVGRWPVPDRVRWFNHVASRVYGLDLSGRFGWVDIETGTSTVVHEFGLGEFYQHGFVSYAEERAEITAGSVRSPKLLRFSNGRVDLDARFAQIESLGAATFHPDLGWFVGTTANGIVHHEKIGGTWTSCNSQLGNAIGSMVPFRDGFIAGSTQGFIEQYSARDGWCQKLHPIENSSSVRFMVPYEDGELSYVVTGPAVEEREQLYSTVSVLRVGAQGECEGTRNPLNDPLPTCSLDAPP